MCDWLCVLFVVIYDGVLILRRRRSLDVITFVSHNDLRYVVGGVSQSSMCKKGGLKFLWDTSMIQEIHSKVLHVLM